LLISTGIFETRAVVTAILRLQLGALITVVTMPKPPAGLDHEKAKYWCPNPYNRG